MTFCSIQKLDSKTTLSLRGVGRVFDLKQIQSELEGLSFDSQTKLEVDGSELKAVDTAVLAAVLNRINSLGIAVNTLSFVNFRPEHLQLVKLIRDRYDFSKPDGVQKPLSVFQEIGKTTFDFFRALTAIFVFMGETTCAFGQLFRNPRLFRMKEFFVQLELGCVNAIPICALVTFLIGVVVAYLFAGQFEKYGAHIFIVDAVSLAMCRELSPIIIAIIVAGRSGSAYTAQIGTMKINEEIDAMTILGLSPQQVLVVPRVLALVVALPALVFVGNVVGILGGLFIADTQLGVTGATYLDRLQTVLTARHILAGLIKAPVFAVFIALIGCRLGLAVENNARSVGLNTTSTVVQSIVAVILLNAAFAIIFVNLGF